MMVCNKAFIGDHLCSMQNSYFIVYICVVYCGTQADFIICYNAFYKFQI